MYVEEKIERETTIKLEDYSGEHNGWDKSRLHPMKHHVTILRRDGTRSSIPVAVLDELLKAVDLHANTGPAIDAVYKAAQKAAA